VNNDDREHKDEGQSLEARAGGHRVQEEEEREGKECLPRSRADRKETFSKVGASPQYAGRPCMRAERSYLICC
jgi:hypothetical protein